MGLWMGACSDGLGNCREVSVAGTAPGSLEVEKLKSCEEARTWVWALQKEMWISSQDANHVKALREGEKKGN